MAEFDDRDEGETGAGFAALLCELMIEELTEEPDETTALRKALLAMLIAHEECDPLFEPFHAFLLTEFAPLASRFTKHQHPLLGDDSVVRGQMADGRLRLLLRESIAERVAAYYEDLGAGRELTRRSPFERAGDSASLETSCSNCDP